MTSRGVCLIPEGRGIFPGLTVAENLQMHSHLRPGVPVRDLQEIAYTRFPRLRDRRKQLAGTMSGGEQHMLALSRALTTDPRVLLIDVSMGLAPVLVDELFEVVRGIAREGRTILVVEQLADYALEVADYAYLMRLGKVVAVGQPADVSGMMTELYVSKAGADSVRAEGHRELADPDALVVTPTGTLTHRASCQVVAARTDVRPPEPGAARLAACRICGGSGT